MVVPKSKRSLAVALALREQDQAASRTALVPRRPLADEVSELIARELIFSDLIGPGELLPSEKELTERYGVSRVTVRSGLRTLKEAGLITVRQGVGAIVMPRSDAARYSLDRLSSLETLAHEAGQELTTADVEIEEQEADAETAHRLEIAEGAAMLVAHRLARIGDAPVAWLVDAVRRDVLSPERLAQAGGSALDALLADPALTVEYADCDLSAVALPADVAVRLGVKAGSVALLLDEVVCTLAGEPLARRRGWHLQASDEPHFAVRRRRRVGG
ncbi:MAG TPA: GntR family transcriptional regulator [Conexibacter sp.]|jgi:DNA-binding GntR family transcriptional regulator|nr:GntR family transcriptional regulator [Conexibacter sp.]